MSWTWNIPPREMSKLVNDWLDDGSVEDYINSVTACTELLRKLAQKGWLTTILTLVSISGRVLWKCTLDNGYEIHRGEDDDICVAVLGAVGWFIHIPDQKASN
jgi:hypothetical protein